MTSRERFARHSPFSDPGRYGRLLRELRGIEEISQAVSNLVLHYRAEAELLREERRDEINARWISVILDLDQLRHPWPLLEPRPPADRVAGCCRDQALLAVAALREQGIPARVRVGFTGYFGPDFRGDHVVAEWWTGDRWQRFDPELEPGTRDFDIRDLATGEGAPFETAAEVWAGYRAGRLDPLRYGVEGVPELTGPGFLRSSVIMEVLHRCGHEVLLWDDVDRGIGDADADELARLLLAADAGDDDAEDHLDRLVRTDPLLRPGSTIVQRSPYGLPAVQIDLQRPTHPR